MTRSRWLWVSLVLPGLVTALAAVGGVWAIARHGAGAGGAAVVNVSGLIGWLAGLVWMATVAGVAVGALAPSAAEMDDEVLSGTATGEGVADVAGTGRAGRGLAMRWRLRLGRDRAPAWFGYCELMDLCGVSLVVGKWAGIGGTGTGGWLGWREVGAIYLLVAAWTGLWTMGAVLLRRWGVGVAVAAPLGLAMLCMSGPIAAMPVVRGGGTTAEGRVVGMVMRACPLAGMLDVLGGGARGARATTGESGGRGRLIEWGSFPLMYAYSGLGQSVPARLPVWWESAGWYGGGAVVLWGLSRRRREGSGER